MAFANDIHSFETGMVRRMYETLVQARAGFAKRKTYNSTLNELEMLSQRELDDLGITRSNIRKIAHEAAYGE